MCSHPSTWGQRPSERFWGKAQLASLWQICIRPHASFLGGEDQPREDEAGGREAWGSVQGFVFTEHLLCAKLRILRSLAPLILREFLIIFRDKEIEAQRKPAILISITTR